MHATLRVTISRITVLAFSILSLPAAAAEVPDAIAAPGEILVATIQAAGAQIYECKSNSAGRLGWQFREPIATLFQAGQTVGRHYAGPNWEMADGSAVIAKVAGARAGRECKRHPPAQARGLGAPRHRPAQRHLHDPAHQYERRRRRRWVRAGRRVAERALQRRLHLLSQARVRPARSRHLRKRTLNTSTNKEFSDEHSNTHR